jgi:hypothetical protein
VVDILLGTKSAENYWIMSKWIWISLMAVCFSAHAALVWDATEQQQSVSADCGEAHFSFTFQNAGTNSVGIKTIRKSCGCLSAGFDQQVYAPGASGTMNVTVDLTDRTGTVEKTLIIVTSEAAGNAYFIKMIVEAPPSYKLSSRQLVWTKDDAEPKSCYFINESSNAVPLASVECKSEGFQTELITRKAGFNYEVKITPASTADRAEIFVYAQTSDPQTVPRKYKFNVIKQRRQASYRPNRMPGVMSASAKAVFFAGSSQNVVEDFSPPVYSQSTSHNNPLPSEPLGGSSSEAGGKIPAVHENVRRVLKQAE